MDLKGMHAAEIRGLDLYSNDGKRIAKVEDVFLDDRTNEPEWLRLGVGLFGMKDVLVPVQAVTREEDRLVVAYSSEMVKDAPSVNIDYISPEEERGLFNYYGIAAVASDSELNPDWGAPPNRQDMVEEVPGNLGPPPANQPGAPRTPEQKAFAQTGLDDPSQVRLRRYVDER
jgi:sporulation protein YlmC with PRC-barrel domain